MFLKLFSLGVPVRLNSENSLFEKAAVPFNPALLTLLHVYTDPTTTWEEEPKTFLLFYFRKYVASPQN